MDVSLVRNRLEGDSTIKSRVLQEITLRTRTPLRRLFRGAAAIEPSRTLYAIFRAWGMITSARIAMFLRYPPEDGSQDIPTPLGSDS
jgi:hypothetical protein